MKSLALRLTIILVLIAGGTFTATAQQGKKEYQFRGKIEKVDAKEKKLTVNGEKVEGWMQAMTMDYKVSKEEVLTSLKAGDQITAKVYDGDFETLHEVQRVAPSNASEPKK
jgi:protein SCO1